MSKYNLSETITEMYAKYVPLKSWEHTAMTVISVTAFVLLFFPRPNSFSLFQRSYVKKKTHYETTGPADKKHVRFCYTRGVPSS